MNVELRDTQIQAIAAALGSAPRWFFNRLRRRYGVVKPPSRLSSDDLIQQVYAAHGQILKDGLVKWSAVVQANQACWCPGSNLSGAQVVVAPRSDVPLTRLLDVARDLSQLKGTAPADPEERRFAQMLTNELERALDWPVPRRMSADPITTTIVMLPREHMPGGLLAANHIPVICDPGSGLAILVPQEFWPDSLRDEWSRNASEVVRRYDSLADAEGAPVLLTLGAARQVAWIANKENVPHFWLYFRNDRAPDWKPGSSPLDIRNEPPSEVEYHVSTQHGVRVAVAHQDVGDVRGVVVKYRENGSGVAFILDESKRESRPSVS